MPHLSLLAGGGAPGRAAWEKAAADVLRRAGRMAPEDPDILVWERLTRTTLEGVAIAPLGTAEAVADLAPTGEPGAAPYTRGTRVAHPEDGWDVRSHLADPDPERAAADAVLDLENGATSLWLRLGAAGLAVSDLPQVLRGVHLDLAPVALDCPDDPLGAAEALTAVLADRGSAPHPGTSLGIDPFSAGVRGTPGEAGTLVAGLAGIARVHGTLALTVDSSWVHDRGGHDAHELGASLAAGVACLRILTEDAGLGVEEAAALLEFRLAVTDEQLTSIAKLRAARRLWARVLELCGAPDAPGQRQHAVTGRAMITRYDPWVNLLRGTVAAFSAGVGGAASVTVLPFDDALGLPDALGRRIARNTSSLLIHEAHVARVTDPAGGSYAIELLTEDLAGAGWAELQRIEADGGLAACLAGEGGLLDRIHTEAAEPRAREVANRRRAVTGVNEFPHLGETLPRRRPHPRGARAVASYGAAFEAMRDAPADASVLLATMGPPAGHTARAAFAANLLAAGGVATVSAGATSGVDDLVAAHDEHGRPAVVCLAGSDAEYAAWGADAVAAVRGAGASYVLVAGPREGLEVDDACALGVDAVALLTRVRAELAR